MIIFFEERGESVRLLLLLLFLQHADKLLAEARDRETEHVVVAAIKAFYESCSLWLGTIASSFAKWLARAHIAPDCVIGEARPEVYRGLFDKVVDLGDFLCLRL